MNPQTFLDRAERSGAVLALVSLPSALWCRVADGSIARSLSRAWRVACWRSRLKTLGPGSHSYPHVVVMSPSQVSIGARVNVGHFVHIWGGGGVTIGDDTLLAAHTVISSETHDPDARVFRDTHITAPVTIGRNCWVGSGAIILPGVTIGDDSVVAAGAVVRDDVPALSIVAGIPARVIRTRALESRGSLSGEAGAAPPSVD